MLLISENRFFMLDILGRLSLFLFISMFSRIISKHKTVIITRSFLLYINLISIKLNENKKIAENNNTVAMIIFVIDSPC